MIIDAFSQSFLLLKQTADCNYKIESADSFLDLHDNVRVNFALAEAANLLVLTDHARAKITVTVNASNVLTLSQSSHHRVHNVEAHSYLILTQQAKREDKWPLILQALTLSHEATCIVAHGTYDTLALVDSATYTIVKIVSAASGLVLASRATAYKPDKMWIADPDLVVNEP